MGGSSRDASTNKIMYKKQTPTCLPQLLFCVPIDFGRVVLHQGWWITQGAMWEGEGRGTGKFASYAQATAVVWWLQEIKLNGR